MHVAHVLRKLDPAAWGGVETHVHALAAALRARDVGGTLFAPRRGPEDEAPGGAPVERYRALLPVLGPAERRRALWAVGGNLISLDLPLRLARDARFALAHAHTQRRVGGAVRVAMRHTGRPYVVSIHGPLLSAPAWVAEESARRRGRSLDVGQPWGALVGARRVLRDADRVIVFNRAEEAAVRTHLAPHGRAERVVRMSQGVDARRFARGHRRATRRALGLDDETPLVMQVGRLGAQKNQAFALEVFARAGGPGVLAFVGAETDPGEADALRDAARAAGVAERVRLLGNQPPERIPDLLAAADLVLAPSRHEAFGLQVVEAWAAGRPTLFAAVGGQADLAAHLDAGMALAAGDAGAWVDRLRGLLADPQARRALGHAAQRAAASFDWGAVAARHESLYAAVCHERGRAPKRL
ncbi:MAG TPA: glycosyltransferase family 4 protein, partial [Polyangiaceae bacterium LLY-WYZ-15_(1-7)]|nr:glycosyltransferase family 4 protein [Polyangiaceae bacterium LLY-WYZ-15_(1-7)]